jgi:hypothetical protein
MKPKEGLERPFRNHVIDRIQASGMNLNENLGLGTGRGMSANATCSGPPYRLRMSAFMA